MGHDLITLGHQIQDGKFKTRTGLVMPKDTVSELLRGIYIRDRSIRGIVAVKQFHVAPFQDLFQVTPDKSLIFFSRHGDLPCMNLV
jgi:hypothetical protein